MVVPMHGENTRSRSFADPAAGVAEGQALDDYADAWDNKHVKLPCSARNTSGRDSKWELLQVGLVPPLRPGP